MHNDPTHILSKAELAHQIGQRIKAIRHVQGISQAELGRLCDKDKQHIELIENGKISPTIYTLYVIAEGLKVALAELVS